MQQVVTNSSSRPSCLATIDSVRLVAGSNLTRNEDYVTLIYCWGKDLSFTKLLLINISAFLIGLPLTQITGTVRDAIGVTRKLGYRYLWIDALCIIQNSSREWLREALSMSKVYASSALNLAAAASHNANGGFFRDRDPARLEGCDILFSWKDLAQTSVKKQTYHVSLFDPWSDMLKSSRLHSKGWAFQERLLSKRSLHFPVIRCIGSALIAAHPKIIQTEIHGATTRGVLKKDLLVHKVREILQRSEMSGMSSPYHTPEVA